MSDDKELILPKSVKDEMAEDLKGKIPTPNIDDIIKKQEEQGELEAKPVEPSPEEVDPREIASIAKTDEWDQIPIPVTPFGNRVLTVDFESSTVTRSGLILPQEAQVDKHNEVRFGRVIAVGPGKLNPATYVGKIPVDVEIGAVVAYEQYKGITFKKDGLDYRLIWDTELIGEVDWNLDEDYAA